MANKPSNMDVAPGLAALMARADDAGVIAAAPVEKWNPQHCGDIGMEIRRDGSWVYQGSVIKREKLVKLFASVLRKDDDGQIYLVTPVEKIIVHVEDAPFIGVELDRREVDGQQILTLRTNMDDVVEIGPQHGLRFEVDDQNGLKPYIHIRGNLEALLSRAMVYQLTDYIETQIQDGREIYSIMSHGVRFLLPEM